MRKRFTRPFAAMLLVAILGATVLAATSSQAITTARTIKVLARETNFKYIDVGPKGESVGDYYLFTQDLLNPKTKAKVGTDFAQCFILFNQAPNQPPPCTVTFDFARKGRITARSQAVTGGTGQFQNVRGELHIEPIKGGAKLTFHLIP